jgi:hypothetical protein
MILTFFKSVKKILIGKAYLHNEKDEQNSCFNFWWSPPGMNAAIRAVVRAVINYKMEICGVLRGFEGLIHGDFIPLNSRTVSNIINRGGTILKTARSE